MRRVWFLVFTIALSGCAKESSSSAAPGKSLFASWTNSDGTPVVLSSGSFETYFPVDIARTTGEVCRCNAYFEGNESSGLIGMSQCTYVGGGSGGDPGCSAMNSSGTYSNSNNGLTICNPLCRTYN